MMKINDFKFNEKILGGVIEPNPFMQWLLERISVNDPPFGSYIQNGVICFGNQCCTLDNRDELIFFLCKQLSLPSPIKTWRELRSATAKQAFLENSLRALLGDDEDAIRQMTFIIWLAISVKLLNLNDAQLEEEGATLRFSVQTQKEINAVIESFFRD